MISIEELKERVEEIPPLPDLVLRLLDMCRDPDIAPRDIVEVIKHDPALTMNVLRLCNSTFYGLPRKISSLQEAMVYIGTDALVNFVLAGHLSRYYRKRQDGYGLDEGMLWRNAVGTAICSQRVAEIADRSLSGSAFTCGLLHCIGKIILNAYVAEEFQKLLDLVERTGIPFVQAEREILGFTHAQIGAVVADHWGLPPEIVESIRYYNDPLRATTNQKLVAIVHVGSILCISFGIGVGSDGLAYIFHPGALNLLEIRVDDLFALSIEIHDQFKNAEEILSLV
ncbi:HDOD domain-containing protein [bacterium]|nr:HDOD domain-containing protein [bacterium]